MKLVEWKNLSAFQSKHRSLASLVWLSSILLPAFLGFIFWADWLMLAPTALAIAYLALSTLSRYEAALVKRIDTCSTAPGWQVDVNGVRVGVISDATYAAIHRNVLLDVRVYLSQLANAGHVLYRAANALFVSIPLGAFWLALALFFFAPNTLGAILLELQQLTPAQIVSGTPAFFKVLAISMILLAAGSAAVGQPIGFINCFDLAVGKSIRQRLGCAAEGDVSVQISNTAAPAQGATPPTSSSEPSTTACF